MFKATAGVNTHKGTIFSLGILTGTVATLKGRQLPVTQLNVQRVVKEMLANLLATPGWLKAWPTADRRGAPVPSLRANRDPGGSGERFPNRFQVWPADLAG